MDFIIINGNPLEAFTAGEKYTLDTKLRTLYKDEPFDRNCIVYVKPIIHNLRPDFVIIDAKYGISVIEVKDWESSYLKSITKTLVVSSDGKKLDNPILKAKRYHNALTSLLSNAHELLNDDGEVQVNITTNLFFPNMINTDLSVLRSSCSPSNILLYAKEHLRSLKLSTIFSETESLINDAQYKLIRWLLFPEIRIGELHTGEDEIIEADNIKALDSEQEKFAKHIPYGHHMVTGVPGSGKTVILLARALYILQKHPKWSILIVTYTKALKNKLEQQVKARCIEIGIAGMQERLEIKTLHKVCYDLIGHPNQPDDRKKEDFYNEFWPKEALKAATPEYDYVLIDEYQDFYVDYFALCLKLCHKYQVDEANTENIFLAGDRLQRIYKPSWKNYSETGIKIIGRSKLLKKSYRTGGDHIDFALSFLALDSNLKSDVDKFYEISDVTFRLSNKDSIHRIYGEITDQDFRLHSTHSGRVAKLDTTYGG